MARKITASIMLLLGSITTVVASDTTQQYKKTLLKAFKECEKIKSGSYDAVCYYKFPFSEKVRRIAGHCTFSKVPSDKVLGARVALAVNKEDGSVTRKLHDGRYEVMIYPEEHHSARVSDLHQDRRPHYIAGNASSGLLFEPLLPVLLFAKKNKKAFQHLIKNRATHIQQLPVDFVEGRPCQVYEVRCKDSQETKHEVWTFFIDQVHNIPIKYVHKEVYWGSPQYTEAAISHFTLSYQEAPSCVPDARAEIPEGYEIVYEHARKKPQNKLLSVGTTAPAWTLPTVQGTELSLAALQGKVVLLSFWYKSFGPSLYYLQALQKLHEQFKDQGVAIVGINLYDDREALAEFLQQRGITYANVVDNLPVKDAYQARTPNTFYIIDQEGKVRYAAIAQMKKLPKKALQRHIKRLLKSNK